MPKRPVTPPTNAPYKYFTVHCAYPGEPNLDLLAHRKEVAFWISNALGNSQDLIALYYKPTSDKVILEINESYNEWRNVLGEHRWNEFLRHPAPQERDLKSQIFFCRWAHTRNVQKTGWKRVDVEESWFRDWKLRNDKIVYPYPATHYCEVPHENAVIEKPLCRPLPVEYFASEFLRPVSSEPEEPCTAPPGSLPYVEEKLHPKSAWARGPASTSSKPSSSATSPKPASPATPPGLSVPKSGSSHTNAWTKNGHGSSTSGIHAPSPITPQTQPTLPRLYTESTSSRSHSSGASNGHAKNASTPALSPETSSPVSGSSSSGDGSAQSPYTPEGAVSLEEAMESMSMQSEWPGEEDYDENDADTWGNVSAGPWGAPSVVETHEEVVENLWAHYGEEQPVPDAGETVIVCTLHGVICKPGICKQYSKQKKEIEKLKQEQERKQAAEAARAKRKKAKYDKPEHPDKIIYNQPKQPRSKPAHLLNPTARAPASPSAASSTTPSTEPTSPLPTPSDTSAASSAGPIPAAAPRAKPAHLTRSKTGAPTSPSSGRTGAQNATAAAASAPPAPAPTAATATGWEHVPTWSGSAGARTVSGKGPADAKSAALSSTGGWGRPVRGPWDAASVASRTSVKKAQGAPAGNANGKKSWADQMEDEDETGSVAASTTSGWGKVSTPWG